MNLVGDRRGQSIQIGAVLLFGVLIIAFASYQAFVVPDQNRGVEYNHNQQVQSDMQDLRNAIVSVPGSTSPQAVSIELSTQYPSRLVARNPGPPSGSLRTNGTTEMRYNITVRNAAAGGETGDVWDGSPRPYNTGTIAYSPNYNVYGNPPTTYYGQSVAYNQFRTANLTLTEQSLVNGKDITLVALNGSLSRSSGGSTSVDVRPVSRSDDPIVVTNDTDSSRVSVSVPTRLPQSVWEELLADEIDSNPGDRSNDRYVADVTTTDGPGPYYNLTITFEQGVDYRLRMAKAGVGSGVSSEEAAYLTDVRGDGSRVTAGDTNEVVLEVRDEYNNPVQGVTVYGGVDTNSDGSLVGTEAVSDSEGQVTFEYDATGVTPGTQQVNFSYRGLDSSFDEGTPEDVTVEVEVTSGNNGGVNGFSSTSVDNLQANDDDLTQTVSFSPEGEAIPSGETVRIIFDAAQQSTVDYQNADPDLSTSPVSENNINQGTGTFTLTVSADEQIETTDTVEFDITGVDTDGPAGPLDVEFERQDTGGSQTATFNVGGGSDSGGSDPQIISFDPQAGSNDKLTVDAEFSDDDSDLDSAEITVNDADGNEITETIDLNPGGGDIGSYTIGGRQIDNPNSNNNKFPAGQTTVTVTVTDVAGNTASESETITV